MSSQSVRRRNRPSAASSAPWPCIWRGPPRMVQGTPSSGHPLSDTRPARPERFWLCHDLAIPSVITSAVSSGWVMGVPVGDTQRERRADPSPAAATSSLRKELRSASRACAGRSSNCDARTMPFQRTPKNSLGPARVLRGIRRDTFDAVWAGAEGEGAVTGNAVTGAAGDGVRPPRKK
jgi:hypothetical protein